MTFQRSLYLTILIHILIFGSAIAFAQFARGALWGNRDVIVVSLVGSGAGSPRRALQCREHRDVRSDNRPAVSHEKSSPADPSGMPALNQSAREGVSLPGGQENKRGNTDSVGDGELRKGQTETGTAGAGSGTQFGLIPAEQWAIIESALERSKTYPRMARERGMQGVVHVRFKLRSSGDVETVEIVKSSGYAILDAASVKTVYRAAPMPYVNGWVEVPMAYVLK
jgi:TonB family protein